MSKEVKQWITVNGKHVPIFEGESKADAVKRAVNNQKSNGKAQGKTKEKSSNSKWMEDIDDQELDEIADRYNTSKPVSGNWNTETEHEQKAIASKFDLTMDEAKEVMKKRLGFDDSDFKLVKKNESAKQEATKVSKEYKAKTMHDLKKQLKEQGLGLEGADSADIERGHLNGEKVSIYDSEGNEYRAMFNKYSDGGVELIGVKKEWYNRKPTDTHSTGVKSKDEVAKEKQIATNKTQADERNGKTSSKMTKKQRLEAARNEIAHLSDEEFKGSAGSATALAKKYNLSYEEAGQIVWDRSTGKSTNKTKESASVNSSDTAKTKKSLNTKKAVQSGKGNSKSKKFPLSKSDKNAEWKITKAYDRASLTDLALDAGLESSYIRSLPTDELRAKLLAMWKKG